MFQSMYLLFFIFTDWQMSIHVNLKVREIFMGAH